MRPGPARVLRYVLAAIIAVLLIQFARTEDWSSVLAACHRASLGLLALAAALNLPLVWCKARRSQLLLAPSVKLPVAGIMRWFFASYAADNLLMSQAGLGLRVARTYAAGVDWTTAVALQGLEKALEAMGLALVALVVQLSSSLPSWVTGALRWAFLLAGVATALALVLLVAGKDKPSGFIGRFAVAALGLRRPRVLVEVLLWSTVAWAIEIAMVMAVLSALGLPAGAPLASLALLAVSIAALLPGLPANVGPFEAAAVLALGAADISRPAALGFALLYHLIHTLPVTLLGLPDLGSSNWGRVDLPAAAAETTE